MRAAAPCAAKYFKGCAAMQERGKLFVVSGPSGVGKGTVCARLFELYPSLCRSVSATTRAMRPGEVEGVNYFYKSKEEFQRMLDEDCFLEHFEIFGNCYGTPRAYVEKKLSEGKDVLLEIDVQGGVAVKQKDPDAVLIFLLPPSFEKLEARLRGRKTEDEQTIQTRLNASSQEISRMSEYRYAVVNDDVDVAAETVLRIMRAEKSKKTESVAGYRVRSAE